MALSIDSKYKRHTAQCTKKYLPSDTDPAHWDCCCNFSVQGKHRVLSPDGILVPQFVRKTTGEWSRDKANGVIRAALDRGYWIDVIAAKKVATSVVQATPKGRSLVEAAKGFLDSRKSPLNDILDETVANYRPTINNFVEWCASVNLSRVDEIKVSHCEQFFGSLGKAFGSRKEALSPGTVINYIIRIRSFDKYCLRHEYCKASFMEGIKPPKPKHKDRPGFSVEQFDRLIGACSVLKNASEAETFLYLMRYTGMAVVDASLFGDSDERAGIIGDELQYYRVKTEREEDRVLVKVPLEPWLLDRLAAIKAQGLHQHGGKLYYFARGKVVSKTASEQIWRDLITPIFKAVGVEGCPFHRLRHTFAKDMLTRWILCKDGRERQIPLKTVSLWLGHRSEETTRKHYSQTLQDRETDGSQMMREAYAQAAAKKTAA